jgi:hypothetical protein
LVIVDDQILGAVLAGRERIASSLLATRIVGSELYTTGVWYWRLTRAAVRDPPSGVLSRLIADLPADAQVSVRGSLANLSTGIGLLSLRTLVPLMRNIRGQANLLTAEAVAAAMILEAPILVSTESPLLRRTASAVGVTVEGV